MVDRKSPTTFLFLIIINNTEGLYETLNSIRKKMKILGQNNIILCYNSPEYAPSKSQIHIILQISGYEDEKTKLVKGLMEFVNASAFLFKKSQTPLQKSSWASIASTISIPYPNSSMINSIEQLLATKTNGFEIDMEFESFPTQLGL